MTEFISIVLAMWFGFSGGLIGSGCRVLPSLFWPFVLLQAWVKI